ncbi:hypothetical protein NDU88_004438 [Pleurodeles waltl]|uniref:Uncharacterized protein n=1 Tax=Pleurodeles waltl TaxID=8319 RepID=A0AAV7PG03_PLEWA|nr:hypothetical protein NDU88_004438 [Pleurodeles waltl]
MWDSSRPTLPGKAPEIQLHRGCCAKPQLRAPPLCPAVGLSARARHPHLRILVPGRCPSPLLFPLSDVRDRHSPQGPLGGSPSGRSPGSQFSVTPGGGLQVPRPLNHGAQVPAEGPRLQWATGHPDRVQPSTHGTGLSEVFGALFVTLWVRSDAAGQYTPPPHLRPAYSSGAGCSFALPSPRSHLSSTARLSQMDSSSPPLVIGSVFRSGAPALYLRATCSLSGAPPSCPFVTLHGSGPHSPQGRTGSPQLGSQRLPGVPPLSPVQFGLIPTVVETG